MNNYAPRPDTVAFKALAHLETLMHGAEVPTGTLAVEAHCEPGSFTQYMQAALKHGVVFARQKGGHPRSPLFWSLVDHSKKDAPPSNSSTEAAQVERQEVGEGGHAEERPTLRGDESRVKVPERMKRAAEYRAPFGCEHGVPYSHPCAKCTPPVDALDAPTPSIPVEKPEVHSLPRVRAGTAPARWGIFSDGDLHIEKAGQQIVLDRGEFEAFVAFLERMAEPQS